MPRTYGDVVTDALTEIRVARAGDVPSPEDLAFGLSAFNRLVDLWNADGRKVVTETFEDVTLTPSLSPHTIGASGGTFTVTVRPLAILAAGLSLGGSPVTYTPIEVRDHRWYAALAVPGLEASVPTDVYYQPDYPLGSLYFWPVPSIARDVRLWLQQLLGAVEQTDEVSLAPGYDAALTLTLAEWLAPAFGQAVARSTELRARDARAAIFANNDEVPALVTRDAGMPGGRGGGFNRLTGCVE